MKKILPAVIAMTFGLMMVTAAAAASISPGSVEFGTGIKHAHHVYILEGRRTVFHKKHKIAWIGVFSSKTTSRTVTVQVDYAKNNSTVLKKVKSWHVHFKKGTTFEIQKARTFASLRSWDIGKPGIYQLQYLQGKVLLAYGNFVLKR